MSLYFHSQIWHDDPYLLPLEIPFPFFCFLLQMTLHTAMFPVSHVFGLSTERQHKLFSLCRGLKYTLYSPQLSDLLMRIYTPSGLQQHSWVHVCLLARNCLHSDWQLPSGEARAFWSLLYLFCLESYKSKVLRQSGLIYSSCFYNCFPDFGY